MIDFPDNFKQVCNVFFPFRALSDIRGVMEQGDTNGILKQSNKEHVVEKQRKYTSSAPSAKYFKANVLNYSSFSRF